MRNFRNKVRRNHILILTGNKGSGKTAWLQEMLPEFESSGIRAGGILAPGRYPENGEKEYDLLLIPHGELIFLSTRRPVKGWLPIGGFFFNPEAVEAGLRHMQTLPGGKYQLLVLDEIGPFELEGSLWAPAITGLTRSRVPMIWTVRRSIIPLVLEKWNIDSPEIISLEKGQEVSPADAIMSWLNGILQQKPCSGKSDPERTAY